jgi:two-component system, NtrC family, nitrogen regulation response regulator NtrX
MSRKKMNVLISDDNLDYCSTIADIVESFGYSATTLQDPYKTIDYLNKSHEQIGILLLDIEFGKDFKINGLDVLEHCRLNFPELPVVMVTGKGSIEIAVKATKLGAINFIEKSVVNKEKIREVLDSAVIRHGTSDQQKELHQFLSSQGIIGSSKIMLDIADSIVKYGRTDLNVMITGETGTGKKLVAHAIHAVSKRAKYPIITVDIPNIPRELFQSELFGHNKGSFSGAIDTKRGLFHKANKGTLFLDEIGDLSLDLQSNLFIPIEEKAIRKVGSNEEEEIDVRFISATDKNLLLAMKDSKFREQLYHRLRECEIQLPGLKERREDIPDIIEFYAKRHNEEYEEAKYFPPATIEYMQEQEWPGNVRELVSVVRVAMQTSQNDEIGITDIHKIILTSRPAYSEKQQSEEFISTEKTLREDIERVDRKKIENTLEMFNGNVSKSAVHLGVSRETLHNKIRKYGIKAKNYRIKKAIKK